MVLDAQQVEILSGNGRILVIQTAFPGDSVLSLPFIQEVKRLYPDHDVEVVCSPVSSEIFQNSPAVAEVHIFHKRGEHKGTGGLTKFASELKQRGYGRVYSLHRSFRTTVLVSLISAKESTGFDTAAFSFLYDRRIKYNHKDHEVKRNLNMLGNYSNDSWKIMPEVNASGDQKTRVESFLSGIDRERKIIAIFPGSVWETKRYPLKYYAELAAALSSQGHTVIIGGSAAEKEMGAEIIRLSGEKNLNTCGELSIIESIEMLRHVSLVVTNDSAPTHFAMAAGAPVLTIYCSTVPEFGFYGYSARSYHLSKDVKCKPCGVHGHQKCPNSGFECGTGLYPHEVLNKINEILTENE